MSDAGSAGTLWLALLLLAEQATRDHLTGLYNRRYFDATLSDHLAAAAEHDVGSADVFFQLGRAELLAGRPASARWAVSQALILAPAHEPARHLLAEINDVQRRMAATAEVPAAWE